MKQLTESLNLISLKESIDNILFDSFINDIDNEIINESLQCAVLQKVAKQLKPFGAKKNYWNNYSFSGLFGSLSVKWDEISDSDVEEYEAGDAAGIKRARKILANSDGLSAILLFPNADGKTYDAMICWRGFYNLKSSKWDYTIKDYREGPSGVPEEYKQKWLKDDCMSRKFIIIDYSKFIAYQKQRERSEAKTGSFLPGDTEYYARLAAANNERYRKIISKKKAQEAAKNDTIAQEVGDIINEVMNLAKQAAQNPDEYISVQYDISTCVQHVYSTKQYDSRRHQSYGSDGLLVLFKSYLENLMSMNSNGGYAFQQNAQPEIKKNIQKCIKDIKSRIININSKIK